MYVYVVDIQVCGAGIFLGQGSAVSYVLVLVVLLVYHKHRLQWDRDWRNRHQRCSIPLWGLVYKWNILQWGLVYMNRLQWDQDWRNQHRICSIPLWGLVCKWNILQ